MATAKHPYPETSGEARALNVLGDKWALLILKLVIEEGPIRFVNIQRALGCSTEQCRTVLNRLVDHGVLDRTRYKEAPPRVDYEATKKGKAAAKVLKQLATWGETWA